MPNIDQTLEMQKLIQQCIQGKTKAQRCIYDTYAKAMYHTIIRMVPYKADAEDILQDAFIKVFQSLKRFENKSTLGAWIKRICINTALNHLRKDRPIDFYSIEEFPVEMPSVEEGIQYNVETIHKAIKILPQGCRTILNLYLFEGYKHREIATALNISESTSKSQYQRGRLLLQKELKSLDHE